MGVVPSKDLEAIQFFESHVPVWQANAVAIGLTAAMVTGLDNAAKAARGSYTAQQNAREAAKAATTALHNNVTNLRGVGGDLIKTIKAFADTTNNPAVYATAQIPPPAPPTPLPPPGQPTGFEVQLTGSGAIFLKWKSTNSSASSGAFFTVKRKLAGEGQFTLVGGTGSKSFVDDGVPFGASSVTYLVQGFRGTEPGAESEQLTVQFGVGGGGQAQVRLAA